MVPSLNTGHPSQQTSFYVRAYSIKEMLGLYDISAKTFYNLLRPYEDYIGPRHGRTYSPLQVERIIQCIGCPRIVETGRYDPPPE